jgi:recombination protein RecA
LKEINSRFGKNSIMKLGAHTFGEVQTSPTGALTLDLALGGGYPKGRVVEIYGPESSGKTTLALHAMAEVQKAGGNVALIDAEHAFDPVFAKRLGVDIDALYLCQPDSGEMALEVADQLIRSSAIDMIAVDSVAALVPRAEIEGEIGQLQVGAQARLMSAALRKIAGNASRHDCTVIFLNQLRQKVGVIYGSPEVTSGGQALKYYASVRLEVRIKERITSGADGQVGIRVKAKCTKNKVAPPYKLAEFDILFGSGISALGCLLDAAEAVQVVQRRGSWYYMGETRLAQGRDKTLEALKEDVAAREKVEALTRQALEGKDVNDLYDDAGPVVDEAFAEGDGVERTKVEDV